MASFLEFLDLPILRCCEQIHFITFLGCLPTFNWIWPLSVHKIFLMYYHREKKMLNKLFTLKKYGNITTGENFLRKFCHFFKIYES